MSDLISAATLRAEIGVDGEVAAATKLAAFGAKVDETAAKQVAGATRIGGAFHTLDGQLGSFGVPFMGTLGRVGTALEQVEGRGKSFGSSLANIGRTEAIAAVVGLAAVSTEAVHLADDLEAAHAREVTAIKNAGQNYGDYAGKIDQTDRSMEKLGFTHAQTESSIAKLLPVTRDTGKALELQAVAADLARGRNVDLDTATSALVRTEGGRYTLLGRLLGLSKDQVASIHSEHDAVALISSLYGGQAAAYAEKFAGKQAIVGAELKDLGAQLGEAIIPQVERFVSGGIAAVDMLQSANTASHGFVGQVGLVAAGLPLAVFGVTKLVEGGRALGAMFYTTSAAATANAQAEAELSAAQSAQAQAAGEAAAANTRVAGSVTTLGIVAPFAIAGLAAISYGIAQNAKNDREFTQQNDDLARSLFEGKAATGAAAEEYRALGPAVAAVARGFVESALAGKADAQSADELAVSMVRAANAHGFTKVVIEAEAHALYEQSVALTGAAGKTAALSQAQQRYGDLLASGIGSERQLAAARDAVTSAARDNAAVQDQVNAATDAGVGAASANTGALSAEAAALAGVAQTAAQAASALSQMNSEADAGLTITIDQHKVTKDLSDALGALHGKNQALSGGGGGGGGGGSHKSVAAAAIDQSQKELALRDALITVGDETANLTGAQHQLDQARQSEKDAVTAAATAEKTYQQVLHGVAADSKAARTAEEDLAKAHLDVRSAVLDEHDAQAALTDTKTSAAADQVAAAKTVKDAEAQLAADRAANADPTILAADEKKLSDAKAASAKVQADGNEKVQRSEIALAEARLRHKDAVDAANESNRVYQGTLHGFPPTSAEAKTAQEALTQANQAATAASDQLGSSVRAVRDAENQAATNALGLKRAQADLNGELNTVSSAGGGISKAGAAIQTFQQKLDAAATAAVASANATGTQIQSMTGSLTDGLLAEVEQLQTLVDSEPLLATALDPVIQKIEEDLRKINFAQSGKVASAHATDQILPDHAPKGHASGGTVRPGEITTLGEQGIELGYLRPDGSGMDILSAPQSRHVIGSGGHDTALVAEIRALRADLALQPRGTYVDKIVSDPAGVIRELDARERRTRMLLSL